MRHYTRFYYRQPLTTHSFTGRHIWNGSTKFTRHYTDRLFKFLVKWGFLRREEVSETSWVRDDTVSHDLLKLINKQMRFLERDGYRPAEVLIGSDTFDSLKLQCAHYTQFETPFEERRNEIFGLKIHLIPYIEGVVVLPKERR